MFNGGKRGDANNYFMVLKCFLLRRWGKWRTWAGIRQESSHTHGSTKKFLDEGRCFFCRIGLKNTGYHFQVILNLLILRGILE